MTRRLGRGLAEIIETSSENPSNFATLRVEQIKAGRFQPRTSMAEAGLEELKASIEKSGIIEPLIVRPSTHGTYELVAGERRFRAAQAVGIKEVPAVIKALSDQEALEYSLIENVQREDLNPVEEAQGCARLADEFGYTQDAIASALGKDRATIANLLRLLSLPEKIQQGVRERAITMGHAKAILSLEEEAKRLALYHEVRARGLSVRHTERLAAEGAVGRKRRVRKLEPQLMALEGRLRQLMGTKVSLLPRRRGGRIIIEFFSSEDLTRLLQLWGASGPV